MTLNAALFFLLRDREKQTTAVQSKEAIAVRFLKMRTNKTAPRAGGKKRITPLIVDTPRKYSKERREQTISVKRCQLIFGAHDSGKTRWLMRLHGEWEAVWGAKIKYPPIYISSLTPMSTWVDAPHVAVWHDKREADKQDDDESYKPRYWANRNQQQKADYLADYLADTGALLFIDDAHKLTGRKLQIARACMINASIWLMTCSQENRLPPNMRTITERRDPQRTRLQTDASYDATQFVVWFLIVGSLGIGWWEAGLVLGGLKMLGSGRRSARPD